MSYVAERRLEEKERRRADILDSAERIFAQMGLDSASMEDIAREARLSRALLYVYFPDRPALHFAICERALKLLGERFEAAAARHVRGLEKVESVGRAYLAFSMEFPLYFTLLTRYESHPSNEIAPESAEQRCVIAGDRVHGISAAAVATGLQDGSIRADAGEPYLVAVTLWGFMHGVIQLSMSKANLLAHDGITSQQLLTTAMTMCGRALSASIAAPESESKHALSRHSREGGNPGASNDQANSDTSLGSTPARG